MVEGLYGAPDMETIQVLEILVEAVFSREQKPLLARAYKAGYMEWADFNPSVQSWIGHASHADTLGLSQSLFSQVNFTMDQRGHLNENLRF